MKFLNQFSLVTLVLALAFLLVCWGVNKLRK